MSTVLTEMPSGLAWGAGVVIVLALIALVARLAADRAEGKARRLLDTSCVCCVCQSTPVLVPGATCRSCQKKEGTI